MPTWSFKEPLVSSHSLCPVVFLEVKYGPEPQSGVGGDHLELGDHLLQDLTRIEGKRLLSETDLLVAFQGKTAHGQRRTWSESPGGCCVIENYVAGTLVIEVFTARDQERIWRGVGSVDLPNEKNLEYLRTKREKLGHILDLMG